MWWQVLIGMGILVVIAGFLCRRKPEPKPDNPYKWIRGILTLNPIPTAKEIKDMGFNVLLPFGHKYDNQKAFIKEYAGLGGKVIMPIDTDVNIPLGSILGYFLMDEPDCRKIPVADMEEKLKKARGWTKKPIGCGFCGYIGCGLGHKEEWIKFINKLDFVLLTAYPYKQSIPSALDELNKLSNELWKDVKVPIIPYTQAIWGDYGHAVFTKPDIKKQLDFWKDRGYGNIAYTWDDGRRSGVKFSKEEWEEVLKKY